MVNADKESTSKALLRVNDPVLDAGQGFKTPATLLAGAWIGCADRVIFGIETLGILKDAVEAVIVALRAGEVVGHIVLLAGYRLALLERSMVYHILCSDKYTIH